MTSTALSRGPIPLHHQLSALLRERIVSGELEAGALMPTELALTQTYGVSRTVVRQAMQLLETQGLITRIAGKGTFVRDTREQPFEGWSINSTEDLQQYGKATRLDILERLEVPAPDDVARALEIPLGTVVSEIRSLRSASAGPFAYQRNFALLDIGRKVAAQQSISSMLLALQEHANIKPLHMMQAISAVAAEDDVARALQIAPASPVLQFEWQLVATDGRKVTFSRTRYRSDRYKHVTRLLPGGG
ncbi:GntR family transcriptional regulator [Verticiella sediminum]|uniref:GntR family transcriptional regulator n=1 Tax=Verticiella sediminum TaxID=1247510 RepID=A0A556A6D4_9BURK|nr:GntR family transcriptional regulator [Verticiella sediminum]TSH88456.1 GntR family transcriptional regulator [Verticiella sediminum]